MSDLLFLRPWLLLALPLGPLFLYLWRGRGGGATPWRKVVDSSLLEVLLVKKWAQETGRMRDRLLELAWILAIVALAGPSWQRLPPPLFQSQAPPLALLLELSPGMEGEALDRARMVLANLLDELPPRPVSLWTWSERAWRVMPPTEDLRLLKRLVLVLSPDLLPLQGSNLARALGEVAASQRETGRAGELLLIGSSSDAPAAVVARSLAEEGHRLHVLAVNGEVRGLGPLAEAGNGKLFRPHQLRVLISALDPGILEAGEAKEEPVPVDDGPWLILLLLPLALLLFSRSPGLLLVLVFMLPPLPAEAGWDAWFQNPDQRAWKLLQQARSAEAAALFRQPMWQGVALYRSGRYREAAAAFARVDTALAHYNRGNALVQLGDLSGARSAWERALALDPGFTDARHNLELLERLVQPAATVPYSGRTAEKEHRATAPVKEAQELLDVEKELELPVPERVPEHDLKSSLGGGMILAPDSDEAKAEQDSRAAGQMYREGATQRTGETQQARRSAKPDPDATPSEAETLPSMQPELPPRQRPQVDAGADAPSAHGRAGEAEEAGTTGTELAVGPPGTGKGGAEEAGGRSGESRRALEVWLESIEDDPAELLRALFRQQLERGKS